MSKMKPHHHELPKYYLLDFCSPETPKHIWVFDRDTPFNPGKHRGRNNPHLRGINQAGLHPKGYGNYESDLQKTEHATDKAIQKVRKSQPINLSEKEVLARYIELTWRRLSCREIDLRRILERRVRELHLEDVARQLADQGRFQYAREVFQTRDWIESTEGSTDLVRKTLIMNHERVHALIMERPWHFIRAASGHYFVTSDIPVVFDRTMGLQASSLLFPMGKDVMLKISHAGHSDLSYGVATPEETRKLNAMVIFLARQEIYSPYPDEWIHKGWNDGFLSFSQNNA